MRCWLLAVGCWLLIDGCWLLVERVVVVSRHLVVDVVVLACGCHCFFVVLDGAFVVVALGCCCDW